MTLNNRELATILAALRERQTRLEGDGGANRTEEDFENIATNGDAWKAMSVEEIDALCERLYCY